MTSEQRQRIYDALMAGFPPDADLRAVGEMVTEDIDRIEPIIDDMLKDASSPKPSKAVEATADTLSHFHPCTECSEPIECWCPFPDQAVEYFVCDTCLS